MLKKNPKIFIIAGEVSGDIIGGAFLSEFIKKNPDATIKGIGGDNILSAGLQKSLFDMTELSLMGIAEIIPKLPKLIGLINRTVKEIEAFSPDIILTLDAPDFSFRVQKKIKKRGKVKSFQVHYVAPTVWAWREGRAKKVSKFLDLMLCLFPFEPEYFIKEGLDAVCVGHSMLETGIIDAKASLKGKYLGLLVGSRKGEISRMLPVYKELLVKLYDYDRDLTILMPTLPHLSDFINKSFSDVPNKVQVMSDRQGKWGAFKSCNVAVATSGTVGLELAVCNIPHIIGYKVNSLTHKIIKSLVKVKYAHLANIILDREVVPEFLQDRCSAEELFNSIVTLLEDDTAVNLQKQEFSLILNKIRGANDYSPSKQAVDAIESYSRSFKST